VPLETATYISDLVSTNPAVADASNQGDDHIRLIKAAIKASFPNVNGAVNMTPAQLNSIPSLSAPGSVHVTPANPTGNASGTLLMMGLGSSCVITPNRSGKVLFIISGNVQNANAVDGWTYQIRYGNGGAPSNGGPLAGTAVSALAPNVAPSSVPFSTQGIITGLTPGTPYWFDLALARFSGTGLASVTNLTCDAAEL
jgi:hypothetical protein